MPARAASDTPSAASSFVVGTSGTTCEAQSVSMGGLRQSIFERKWVVLCSDVSLPVGTAYAFEPSIDPLARVAPAREEALECDAARPVETAGGASVQGRSCTGRESGLEWRSYSTSANGKTYVVEGLAGYDSALRLTIANLATDSIVPGEVAIAAIGSGGSRSIIQSRSLVVDAETLVGEGYRGNSAGAFAEAAQAFASAPALIEADSGTLESRAVRLHEAKINRALQLSNLGNFEQADRLFAEAEADGVTDPIQVRLTRNYTAIHALNRGDRAEAIRILDGEVPPLMASPMVDGDTVSIDSFTAAGLNSTEEGGVSGILGQPTRLSPQERATIIDAQALQLRGTAKRLSGDVAGARADLATALQTAVSVRNGRVASIARLRAQIYSELAITYEAEGKYGEAEAYLRRALELVEFQYPDSTSVNMARARMAGFLARRGEEQEARATYRAIVENVATARGQITGFENLMRPYFDMLVARGDSSPEAVSELFDVAQLVPRPGAADTLIQLSRELESGRGEAAQLYRRGQDISRELERARIELARLEAAESAGAATPELAAVQDKVERLATEQRETVNALSAYPSYRAVASGTITLDELRGMLGSGEAYLKMVELAGSDYAIYASPTRLTAWKLPIDSAKLDALVTTMRDSISIVINGVQTTYPFQIGASAELYDALLGPVAGDLASVKHIVFEPDGAMLELPLNLLTGDSVGIEAYRAKVARGGDEYDFTGIDWLGRNRAVSTAISAASFRDARNAPVSAASKSFLGLGQNAPLGGSGISGGMRNAMLTTDGGDAGCLWPAEVWNNPISARELVSATNVLDRGGATLLTGSEFTDTAVKTRDDLADYRILHFATHGLVTAPAMGCPVRPALLTSFGGPQSDGLLSFSEIFDLKIDANLVVLSACDTAGGASLEATKEAGVVGGGGQSLDGLVRAFIAAGGRQIVASHWPAPDDYDATERLFTNFYRDKTASTGEALRQAELALMDDPDTSHPFYWAGFAIIGDAAKPIAGD
ncbi:CHAT domain-containing protein [Novosphingobium sp. PC22D]|nr:CHAT domain-containing protein [Novosphingobium sp. PC22D]